MDSLPSYSREIPVLYEEHYKHLLASAINPDVMRERGYRSILTKDDLEANGFFKSQRLPGLLIPVWGVDGKQVYSVLRPDKPRRIPRKGKDDKVIKYEQPRDTLIRLDVHPRCTPYLKDPTVPLFITEGFKKGDALVSAGALCVLSIPGVWNWRGTNDKGGKTANGDFESIALNRVVYIVFDSDLWSNFNIGKAWKGLSGFLESRKSEIHTIKIPGSADGHKVGADDYLIAGHTLQDLLDHDTQEKPASKNPVIRLNPDDIFKIDETGFYHQKSTPTGVVETPTGNFVARIVEDIVTDDGQTSERKYRIAGVMTKDKTRLPIIEVPAGDFKSLGWIDKLWGSGPFLYTGISRGVEEQFITSVRKASVNVSRKTVYTHTGWREINGRMEFLTAGGALGNPDVLVEVDDSIQNYNLPTPAPGTDMVEAVKTSLDFMQIGATPQAQKFLMPLWAEMYLAPLCHVLKPTFTLWFYGESGAFKSTVSALALSHFGQFDDTSLPSNFHDTENAIEQLLYWAKDLPIIVDDWAPGQTAADAQQLERKAERINRSQGNRQGRRRMKQGEKQTTFVPRGLMVVTAEQLPRGHSNTARILSMKISKGDIDIEKLTQAQKAREAYRTAMAGYIGWLKEQWQKDNWSQPNNQLRERVEEFRNDAYRTIVNNGQHPRIPQMVAFLHAGLYMGASYAESIGAVPTTLFNKTLNDGWDYLISLAKEQSLRIVKESAVRRFLSVFVALLTSGVAITSPKTSPTQPSPGPGARFVGWEDEEFYYLIPETIYAMVVDFCQHTGEIFTVKDDVVWEQMLEQGLIVNKPSDKGKTTTEYITCKAKSVRVIKLKLSACETDAASE